MKPPICKECTHYSREGDDDICNALYHIVTGEILKFDCLDVRRGVRCDLEGKLFERKEPNPEVAT